MISRGDLPDDDLRSRLRSAAADSITAAVEYLAGDGLPETAIDAASEWVAAAEEWEDAFGLLALQVSVPGDLPWLSRVLELSERGYAGRLDPRELSDLLETTATMARIGADRIRVARQAVRAAIGRAGQSAD